MSKKADVVKEIKGLGKELGGAFKKMVASKEFKTLEKDISNSVRFISSSLKKGLEAARQSQSSQQLKTRLNRVVKAGAIQGKLEAKRAQETALKGLKKATKALKDLSQKLKEK